MTPTVLVVDALAVHRLTRLVTEDVITEAPRRKAIQWAYGLAGRTLTVEPGEAVSTIVEMDAQVGNEPPKLATLLTCRWCAGAYVAAFAVLARRHRPGAWHAVASAAALSSAAALIAGLED